MRFEEYVAVTAVEEEVSDNPVTRVARVRARVGPAASIPIGRHLPPMGGRLPPPPPPSPPSPPLTVA